MIGLLEEYRMYVDVRFTSRINCDKTEDEVFDLEIESIFYRIIVNNIIYFQWHVLSLYL